MYRKIIHTIREEHFDEKPQARVQTETETETNQDTLVLEVPLLIKVLEFVNNQDLDETYRANLVKKMLNINNDKDILTINDYDDIVSNVNVTFALSEEAMNFRMNARTLWSRYLWGLLNYAIALNNEMDGKEQAEARIYKIAHMIGDMVRPYYGDEHAAAITESLSSFAKIGINVMNSLKAGIPLDGTVELWTKSINDLAEFFDHLNPKYWPRDAVKYYFENLVNLWVTSIQARNEKNWEVNDAAIENMDKLIALGDKSQGLVSLADVFSSGVINMFPDKFID